MSQSNFTTDTESNNSNQPYEPYELNADHTAEQNHSTIYVKNPTNESAIPSKEESLGQNQVANCVSDSLRHSLAWDTTSGQCWCLQFKCQSTKVVRS